MCCRPRLLWLAIIGFVAALTSAPSAQFLSLPNPLATLDPPLQQRAAFFTGRSRVVVRAVDSGSVAAVTSLIVQIGGSPGRRLSIINGEAATIPNAALQALAASPLVAHLSLDRFVAGSMERTGTTIGATAVRNDLGLDGSGIGVAVIDSGAISWHDDLGSDHIDQFVDFVNGRPTAYDDYGHGTHVAGIIGGSGFDSDGARSGIAPGVHLTVLKVLDASGAGHISDVIAALDYVVDHRIDLGIRVANLSIATGVYESYNSDPLTLAALAAVRSGIVVVAAAGNNGRNRQGQTQYGGVTAPGNAPWVLTVGASSHMGTIDRDDDTMAAFSSRGPTAVDNNAKPDLVAPGVGVESLSNPDSAMYSTRSAYLLRGTVPTSYFPYLSLSGTSMAAPVVSGTVALMLQANPALTPNAIKAILQYTAQTYPGWDVLTQGAGFLNAQGAVDLARTLGGSTGPAPSAAAGWSRHIVWGTHLASGGRFTADATAWRTDVTWGDATVDGGQVDWGVVCSTNDCSDTDGSRWRPTSDSPNVVWGTACGGSDCTGTWQVSGSSESDTVVWGTTEGDTVVWGTSCDDPSCDAPPWNAP